MEFTQPMMIVTTDINLGNYVEEKVVFYRESAVLGLIKNGRNINARIFNF